MMNGQSFGRHGLKGLAYSSPSFMADGIISLVCHLAVKSLSLTVVRFTPLKPSV